MKFPAIATTGSFGRPLALGAALFVAGLPAANALTLDLSSIQTGSSSTAASIAFDGASGFSFKSSTGGAGIGYGFTVATSAGSLLGKIDGTFTIGTSAGPSVAQQAPIGGFGTVTIDDGAATFTAKLTFDNLYNTKVGNSGGFLEGSANLTTFSYSGTNVDLLALKKYGSATQVITFQFSPGKTIPQLKTQKVSTSYSGTITAVPIPAAAWLFGTALIGVSAIGRRKRQAQKQEA